MFKSLCCVQLLFWYHITVWVVHIIPFGWVKVLERFKGLLVKTLTLSHHHCHHPHRHPPSHWQDLLESRRSVPPPWHPKRVLPFIKLLCNFRFSAKSLHVTTIKVIQLVAFRDLSLNSNMSCNFYFFPSMMFYSLTISFAYGYTFMDKRCPNQEFDIFFAI